MQVILIKDVDNLGAAHEMVEVKPGYARNYLIPQKYAIEASESNKKIMEERHKQLNKKEAKLMAEIANVTEVLKASPVKVGAKIGISGKIFGSVTAIQIARAIREQHRVTDEVNRGVMIQPIRIALDKLALRPRLAVVAGEQRRLEFSVITVHHSTHEQDARLTAHVVQRIEAVFNLSLDALAAKHVRGESITHGIGHRDIPLVLLPLNLARQNILNLGDILAHQLVCHELVRGRTDNRAYAQRRSTERIPAAACRRCDRGGLARAANGQRPRLPSELP